MECTAASLWFDSSCRRVANLIPPCFGVLTIRSAARAPTGSVPLCHAGCRSLEKKDLFTPTEAWEGKKITYSHSQPEELIPSFPWHSPFFLFLVIIIRLSDGCKHSPASHSTPSSRLIHPLVPSPQPQFVQQLQSCLEQIATPSGTDAIKTVSAFSLYLSISHFPWPPFSDPRITFLVLGIPPITWNVSLSGAVRPGTTRKKEIGFDGVWLSPIQNRYSLELLLHEDYNPYRMESR
jgi:hypothetical protein